MNEVILMGNLTRDPETGASNGTTYCRFQVACQRYSKDGEASADFIPCVAFGKNAENIGKFFIKGSKILVRGSINISSYEKDGKRQYSTNVLIHNFEFVDRKSSNTPAPTKTKAPEPKPKMPENGSYEVTSEEEDDLPF